MLNDPIRAADYLVRKYKTRDPFKIIEARHVLLRYPTSFAHLLGYARGMNGIKAIGLNGNASEEEKREGAGHELGHIVLHVPGNKSVSFTDTFFYSRDNSRRENEANLFNAELQIPDEKILKPIGCYLFQDCIREVMDEDPEISTEGAKILANERLSYYGDQYATVS